MKKLLDYFGDWTFGSLIIVTLFTAMAELLCWSLCIALFPLSVFLLRFAAWTAYPEQSERRNTFTRPIILATIASSVAIMSMYESLGWKMIMFGGIIPAIAGYLFVVIITNPKNFALLPITKPHEEVK